MKQTIRKHNKLHKNQYYYRIKFSFTQRSNRGLGVFNSLDLFKELENNKFTNVEQLCRLWNMYFASKLEEFRQCATILNQIQHESKIYIDRWYQTVDVFTNNALAIEQLRKIRLHHNYSEVVSTKLQPNQIYLPNIQFDYKITLKNSTDGSPGFGTWAKKHKNVRLTPKCEKLFNSNRTQYDAYFYVSGENTLLLVQMMIGTAIRKIEYVVNDLSTLEKK